MKRDNMFYVKIYRILFTFINRIRILLHLDRTMSEVLWKKRGRNVALLDVQIDGYEKRHKELAPILEEMKNDVFRCFNMKLSSGTAVLDYGCGTGRYLELFSRIPGVRVVGADLSENILSNYTRKKYQNMEIVCADFTRDQNIVNKYADTFDGVNCISVIEYVRYTRLPVLIKAFSRVLKKQGILYLSFPHCTSKWHFISNLRYIYYYPEIIEKYLLKNGFIIKESHSFHHNRIVRKVDDSGLPNYEYIIIAEKI